MRYFNLRNARLFVPAALVAALIATGTLFASADDGLKIPANFQHDGYLANSMLVMKELNKDRAQDRCSPHLREPGRLRPVKLGGSTPYPDGTVFVDDVREFSVDDGAYQQGGHKFITVMVRNSKKYASTGGWGFQAWLGGDPAKPIVTDAVKQCFACHVPQEANDHVFSTYLQ